MTGANRIYKIGAVFMVMLLCLGPAGYLLGVAGWTAGGGADGARAYAGGSYGVLLGNTLVVSLGTTACALFMALPLAFALARMRLPMGRMLGAVVLGCAVLPLHIYVAAWVGALGIHTASGVLPKLAGGAGNARALWDAVLIGGLAKVPLATLLMGLSLWGIRPEAEEAAWLDTSRAGVFWHVVLRHVGGSMVFAGSILFGLCLGEIAVTDILSIRTLAEETYILFQLTMDPQVVVAAGTLVFSPILIPWLMFLCARPAAHLPAEEAVYLGESAVFSKVAPEVKWGISCIMAIAIIAICGTPLATFVRLLFRYGGVMRGAWDLSGEYFFSLGVGAAAAILSSAIAFPLVFICNGTKWGVGMTGIALCGLLVPGAATGIALVKLFNRAGVLGMIYNSSAIIVIGQFLRYFPLSILILWAFLRTVPRQYEQMAIADGATLRDVLFRVYLPICARPFAVSAVIVFLWCLGDLDTSLIVCPPGTTTLPIRMFTMLHYGVYGEVAIACLMLVVTVVGCLALAVGLVGRDNVWKRTSR